MKLLFTALLLIGGYKASAAEQFYNLKMKLALDGKHVSSPQVIVKAGEKAMITQDDKTFIEIVTTEEVVQERKGIMMKFVVGTIGHDGKRAVLAKPQILALENEPAQITISEKENGPEQMSLSVVATKTTL